MKNLPRYLKAWRQYLFRSINISHLNITLQLIVYKRKILVFWPKATPGLDTTRVMWFILLQVNLKLIDEYYDIDWMTVGWRTRLIWSDCVHSVGWSITILAVMTEGLFLSLWGWTGQLELSICPRCNESRCWCSISFNSLSVSPMWTILITLNCKQTNTTDFTLSINPAHTTLNSFMKIFISKSKIL